MPDQTNITDFDPATGRTTTTLVSDHDRGAHDWATAEGESHDTWHRPDGGTQPPGGGAGSIIRGALVSATGVSTLFTPPADHPPIVVPYANDDVIIVIDGTPLGRYRAHPVGAPGVAKIKQMPEFTTLNVEDADGLNHADYLVTLEGQYVDFSWHQPPAATLTSITPGTIARDTGVVSVVATGTNFTPEHKLYVGYNPLLVTTNDDLPPEAGELAGPEQLVSTYVSSTQIDATIDTSLVAGGTMVIFAAQGSSTASATNTVPLTVTGEAMVFTSVVPAELPRGINLDVTIFGSGFAHGLKVKKSGSYTAATWVSSTEALAKNMYPYDDVTGGGTSVLWLDALSTESNRLTVPIVEPFDPPLITAAEPPTFIANTGVTVTLTGVGFVPEMSLLWVDNGSGIGQQFTLLSDTQLTFVPTGKQPSPTLEVKAKIPGSDYGPGFPLPAT